MDDMFLNVYRKDGKRLPTKRMVILFKHPLTIHLFIEVYGDALLGIEKLSFFPKGLFGVLFNCTKGQREYLCKYLNLHHFHGTYHIYTIDVGFFNSIPPQDLEDLVFLGHLSEKEQKNHSLYAKYA